MIRRSFSLLVVGMVFLMVFSPVQGANQTIIVLEIEGVINPFTARYLDRGLEQAQASEATLVVLTLNTPGGLESSMREMVQSLLETATPVVVFVSPSGARASSAGLFILMAGDFAAMAPATNVGAATPVPLGGEIDEVMNEKALSDASALIRSLAERRDRNVDLVESAVRESLSLSASEALEQGVIEIVAEDIDDLLIQLDGRTADDFALSLSDPVIERESMNWVERFYHTITEPNIAYLLLSLGILFLLAELSDPGLSFAGIGAVVCFMISFMALGNLPVNWAAIGMLVISLVLFVVALLTDTEVIVTAAGLIPFILGSLLLFTPFRPDSAVTPELRVSPWLVILMAGIILIFSLVILRAILSASKLPPRAGAERLIGDVAVAETDLDPDGRVSIDQQDWSAISEAGFINKGQKVQVVDISGVRLHVRPIEAERNQPE